MLSNYVICNHYFALSMFFQDTKGLSDDEAGFGLRAFDLSVSSIKAECPWDDGVKCDVQSKNSFDSKYRRADGSCNNLDKVNYGRSTTPFQRIIEKPAYQKVKDEFSLFPLIKNRVCSYEKCIYYHLFKLLREHWMHLEFPLSTFLVHRILFLSHLQGKSA